MAEWPKVVSSRETHPRLSQISEAVLFLMLSRLSVYPSISPSVHSSNHPFIHLPNHPCLSIYQTYSIFHLFIPLQFLSHCVSVFIHPSTHLPKHTYIHLPSHPSIIHPSVYTYIQPHTQPSFQSSFQPCIHPNTHVGMTHNIVFTG